jgi:hypothetical protein
MKDVLPGINAGDEVRLDLLNPTERPNYDRRTPIILAGVSSLGISVTRDAETIGAISWPQTTKFYPWIQVRSVTKVEK